MKYELTSSFGLRCLALTALFGKPQRVKYELTSSFEADWPGLSLAERRLFRQAVQAINHAYARRGARPLPHWPAYLRIKAVRGAPGV